MAIVEVDALDDNPCGLASEVDPPLTSPFDVSHMSVWDTIRWVAREGGAKDFDVGDQKTWDDAYDVVVKGRLCRDDDDGIPVTGHAPGGAVERVPGTKFLGVRVERSHQPVTNEYANSLLYGAEESILCLVGSDGDRLLDGNRQPLILDLRISSRDVLRFWSFGSMHPPAGEWLQSTLAHLALCRDVREAIGWDEASEMIDPTWLRKKGFGPSTPLAIETLQRKLCDESDPPRPAVIPTGVPGLHVVSSTGTLQGTPGPASYQDAHNVDFSAVSTFNRDETIAAVEMMTAKKNTHHKRAPERLRVIETMRSELASGRVTAKALHQMIEKTMETKYSSSRDTCRRARYVVFVILAAEKDLASGALNGQALKAMTIQELMDRYGHPKDRRPDETCEDARDILLAEHLS